MILIASAIGTVLLLWTDYASLAWVPFAVILPAILWLRLRRSDSGSGADPD